MENQKRRVPSFVFLLFVGILTYKNKTYIDMSYKYLVYFA